MYNKKKSYSCPYYINPPMDNLTSICDVCQNHQCPNHVSAQFYNSYFDYPFSNLYNQSNYDRDYDLNNNADYDDYMDEAEDEEYMDEAEDEEYMEIMDYGPNPFVVDINDITRLNNTFRSSLWTGDHLQVTLMSLEVDDEIGLELHPDVDQFLRVEEGEGIVLMGDNKENLDYQENIYDDFAIVIPAGKWHNLINTGDIPLKIYSIYAPPHHPHGTVHVTREDAMMNKNNEQS